jgi:YidC/Oxa1 family membrane protein insertase
MERRLLIAIGLMLGVIALTNLIFPPVRTEPPPGAADTAAVATDTARSDRLEPLEGARQEQEEAPEDVPTEPAEERLLDPGRDVAADTIQVVSPLYRLRFVTRGAALVSAQLTTYGSYAPDDPESVPVELVRSGDRVLGFRVAVGPDTVDLSERPFEASASEITVSEGAPRDSLTFHYVLGSTDRGPLGFRVTYHFDATRYLIKVRGEFEGVGDRGYTIATSLGEGLRTNEASAKEDFGQLALTTRGRSGIQSLKLSSVDDGEREAAEGGPFDWVAVKNKYFLTAYLVAEGSPGFGGVLLDGLPDENAARITATLPVPAGSPEFAFDAYMGPQDYTRLTAIGNDLHNVNPVGWRWLQPVIRPLVAIVMVILTWMHEALGLAWGWVLILFGVLMRIVLFPLYQKSMRAQMAQMRVQPLMKDIREKYKDEPQRMQQEMMRLYKEHNINPLAGCLPMMLPFPVLITLFFVFRNTIVFRGVPFLWLPDLSLKDPFYIVPLLMGGSMFLLTWIGQRGMEQTAQTRMMGWGMPIMFTFLFANFPSGLNLYYATSNFASLPQQLYIARERQKAKGAGPVADESGTTPGESEPKGSKGADKPGGGKPKAGAAKAATKSGAGGHRSGARKKRGSSKKKTSRRR